MDISNYIFVLLLGSLVRLFIKQTKSFNTSYVEKQYQVLAASLLGSLLVVPLLGCMVMGKTYNFSSGL